MTDLISRQAAIDAVYKCADIFVGDMPVMVVKADAYEALAQLPSAQPERPEQPESAKEYCAECDHIEMCRWYPYEGCEFRSLPSAQPEIIQCRNCKFASGDSRVCMKFGHSPIGELDFCAWAERRTDD